MELNRLKNIIDVKNKLPKNLSEIIKSDVYFLINDYLQVKFDNVNVQIETDKNNKINIDIHIIGDKLKLYRSIN